MYKTNEELEAELQQVAKNLDQAKKVQAQSTTRMIQIQAILQDRFSKEKIVKETETVN